MNAAVSEHKKTLKIRLARKYLGLYKVLLKKFKEVRSKGFRIDFNWIWSKACNLHRDMTNEPDAIIRKHVIVNFIKRHNICMRARKRNCKLAKEDFRQKLEDWHLTTRERLTRLTVEKLLIKSAGVLCPINASMLIKVLCHFPVT